MFTTVVTPREEEAATAKQPPVPVRPVRKTQSGDSSPSEERKVPAIPERSKPPVPARPSKLRGTSSEEVPLARSTSAGSNDGEAPTVVKAKPAVPARPSGSKIASLQANFMNDLNKKLGLGPQAPKKEETKEPDVEDEKAPLADARKGRARGPQRRKPGVSPSGIAAAEIPAKPTLRFSISTPQTIWEVDEGVLSVPGPKSIEPAAEEVTADVARPVARSVASETSPNTQLVTAFGEDAPEKAPGDKSTTSISFPSEKLKIAASAKSESSADMAVQTGQQDIEFDDSAAGEKEKATVYLGGRAPEPGTVIKTADGKEFVGDPDTLGRIERTGDGI